MKAKEVKDGMRTAVHAGVQQWIDRESANGTLKLGGVVLSAPNRLKVRLVDSEFKPHTFNVLIEEASR